VKSMIHCIFNHLGYHPYCHDIPVFRNITYVPNNRIIRDIHIGGQKMANSKYAPIYNNRISTVIHMVHDFVQNGKGTCTIPELKEVGSRKESNWEATMAFDGLELKGNAAHLKPLAVGIQALIQAKFPGYKWNKWVLHSDSKCNITLVQQIEKPRKKEVSVNIFTQNLLANHVPVLT